MADVNTDAAPSSASEQQVHSFKDFKNAWNEGKEAPEVTAPKSEEAAASDPSKETSSADDKSQSSPESETGKAQESKTHRKPGAEDRIRELVAETKRLQTELEEARKAPKTEKAESSTAKPAEQSKLEPPAKPKLDDFKTYEEYEAAKDEYYEKLADYKAKVVLQQDAEQRAHAAAKEALDAKLAEARKAHEDWDAVAVPTSKAIFEDQQIHGAVKAMIDASPVFAELLYEVGKNGADDLVTTAQRDPIAAIRKIVLLEAQLMGGGKPAENKAAAAADKKVDEAPDKPTTKVPPPPSEVGGRGVNTEDPDVSVARSGSLTREAKDQWTRSYSSRKH